MSFAQTEPPQFFTLDGRLFTAGSDTDPLLDSNIMMTIQVLDPAKTCVLYEEQQSISTLATNGYFSVRVGSALADPKRTGNDVGNSLVSIFYNSGTVINGDGGCTYTPAAGDERYFRFFITPSTVGVTSQLTPDMTLDSVPQAIVAQTLQGLGPSDVFRTSVTSTQAKLDNLLTTNYTALTDLVGGSSTLYLPSTADGTQLPSTAVDPVAPSPGQVWYNSTSNELKYYNGTTVEALTAGGAGGTVTSIATGTGLTGGPITATGTISIATGGVTDAMLATGIDASKITVGTLPAGVVPTGTDDTKLPLLGGTMTGALDMGTQNVLNTGHITMNAQRTITIGRFTTIEQTALIGTLGAPNAGATWFNSDTGKMMYWTGAAAREISEMTTAGGDITSVVAGTGLTGGALTGAATLNIDIGTSSGQLFTIDTVPNCTTGQKLQMSAGPIYLWSCVSEAVPTMIADADNDTRIRSEATADDDTLRFETAGSERMVIGATGSVGIGTTTPQAVLDLYQGDLRFVDQSDPAISYNLKASLVGGDHRLILSTQTAPNGARLWLDSQLGTASGFSLASDAIEQFYFGQTFAGAYGGISYFGNDFVLLTGAGGPGTQSTKFTLKNDGNVGIGTNAPATKLEIAGTIKIANGGETCTVAANAGMVRYTAGSLQYCNGAAWQTLGISGAGLTSLNGQTGSTQTFANGSTGLTPAFSSAGNTHTLNIPLASGAGVTSGTITKAEYDSFVAKLSAVAGSPLAAARIWVGDGGGQAAAVLMSGDATLSDVGLLTIANNAVTTSKINAGAVTDVKLASDAVTSAKILDGTIATADIANSAVTNAKIDTVSVSKITSAATEYFTYMPAGTECAPDQVLKWNAVSDRWLCGFDVGVTDHGVLTGLSDDDHTQYTLLAGRAGGQNLRGGVAASENLTLESTSHATKGHLILQPTSGNVGIGVINPQRKLHIVGDNSDVKATVMNSSSTVARYPAFEVINYTGSFSGVPRVSGTTYRGDVNTPSAVQSGDALFAVEGAGGRDAAYNTNTTAQILMTATETYSPTAGGSKIAFKTTANSSVAMLERMTISQDGNVGIGTITPGELLHIYSPDATVAIFERNALLSSAVEYKNTGGSMFAGLATNLNFGIGTNMNLNSASFVVSPAGNVGIGTIAPDVSLDFNTKTDAVRLPAGTDAQRPAAANGMIRYNTTSNKFEGYENGAWVTLRDLASGGVIGAGAGAVGTPSLSFSGDPNTGFYSNGADILGVTTNGVNRFNISSAGLVSSTTGGGLVTSGNGTEAAPTFSFSGDADTGWWRPAADTMAASTAGVERLRLTSTGSLGVGTITPDAKLDVFATNETIAGNNGNLFVRSSSAMAQDFGGQIAMGGHDGTFANRTFAMISGRKENATSGNYAGYMAFATRAHGSSSAERMRITSGGYVGIGTTVPSTLLQIGSAIYIGEGGVAGSTATGSDIRFSSAGMMSSDAQMTINIDADNNTTNSYFSVAKDASTSSSVELFRVQENGNVGIGTSSPNAKLEVLGSIYSQGQIYNSVPTGEAGVYLSKGDSGVTNTHWGILNTGAGSETANRLAIGVNSTNAFGGMTERLSITNAGNVGIGTTTPLFPLHVSGNGPFSSLSTVATFDTYSTSPLGNAGILQRAARGTSSAPTALQLNDVIAGYGGRAYGATAFSTNGLGGSFLRASENFTDTAMGTHLIFQTTGLGSTTTVERMRMDSAGNIGIGTTAPSEKLEISGNTTNSAANNTQFGYVNRQSKYQIFDDYNDDPNKSSEIVVGAYQDTNGDPFQYVTHSQRLSFYTAKYDEVNFASNVNNPIDDANVEYTATMTLNNGYVGIGTTSPIDRLTLWDTTDLSGSNADEIVPILSLSRRAANQSLILGRDSNTNENGLIAAHNSDLRFGRYHTLDTPKFTPYMVVKNGTGHVGVGTMSPQYKMTITGDNLLPQVAVYGNDDKRANIYVKDGVSYFYGYEDVPAAATPMGLGGSSTSPWIYMTSGNVGVGTTVPTQQLHVYSTSTTGSNIRIESGDVGGRGFTLKSTGSATAPEGAGHFSIIDNTANSVRFKVSPAGNVGIGTTNPAYKLDVQGGDINASGSVRAAGVALTSDIRYKKEIEPLEQSLDKILSIRGVSYKWRTEDFPQKHFNNRSQIGLIAQQVEEHFPEVVDTNSEGYKSVNYPALVAPLVESIRALYYRILKIEESQGVQQRQVASVKADVTSQISKLEKENAELKKENELMKSRIDKIEKMLNAK